MMQWRKEGWGEGQNVLCLYLNNALKKWILSLRAQADPCKFIFLVINLFTRYIFHFSPNNFVIINFACNYILKSGKKRYKIVSFLTFHFNFKQTIFLFHCLTWFKQLLKLSRIWIRIYKTWIRIGKKLEGKRNSDLNPLGNCVH